MENSDYWLERAKQNAVKEYQYAQRKAQLVTRWFKRCTKEMQGKVRDFYRKYADKEKISYQKAKEILPDRDALNLTLEEYQKLIRQYPQDATAQKLLDKAYSSRAVSHEEFLILQLNMLATKLYGEYATDTGQSLTKAFEEIYYKTVFDYQQSIGHGSNFGRISTHQIQAATSTAWKGKDYSERIWGDQRQSLARYLNRIVTSGVIQGSSNGEMTAQLQAAMDTHAYQARRLIRTEHSQVASKANLLAYQENDTPRFQFRAVLDYRTSEICRDMDGKVFLVSDGKVGINMPPLHPFCRSKTVPYRPDDELDADDTRAARNGKGETYQVPASMTYRDWYDEHVKGHADELLAEQKYKNGMADAKQYEQYKATLGKQAPRTFDQFQNMKYSDSSAWDALKSKYRSQNYQSRKAKK